MTEKVWFFPVGVAGHTDGTVAPPACSTTNPEEASSSAESRANPHRLLTLNRKSESLLGSGFIALAPRVFVQHQTGVADWPSVYIRTD